MILSLGVTSFAANDKDSDDIKEVIKQYYDKSYDMWLSRSKSDLSDVLDLESPQSFNKDIALGKMILNKNILIEQGYIAKEAIDVIVKGNLAFEFKDIMIKGNKATLVFDIEGEVTVGYPLFVSFGENKMYLEKIKGQWKIQEHDYISDFIYE